MRWIVGLWERWLAVLRRREPGEALALFRIITGLSLLLNLLPAIRLGLVRVLWMDVSSGGYRGLDGAGSWLVRALGGPTPEVVGGLVAATLAAGLLVMIGLGGRWPALVAGQGMLAISMINNDAKGSYDALLCDSLWILFLAGGTATLSLDCRRRCGRWWVPSSVAAWPRYLAILQIAAVYGSTGLHKVSAFWTPMGGYSALYYILQQPTWHRWEMSALAWVFPLTQAATAATWCWEVFWPLLPLHDDAAGEAGGDRARAGAARAAADPLGSALAVPRLRGGDARVDLRADGGGAVLVDHAGVLPVPAPLGGAAGDRAAAPRLASGAARASGRRDVCRLGQVDGRTREQKKEGAQRSSLIAAKPPIRRTAPRIVATLK
jgi:hypothetical protein